MSTMKQSFAKKARNIAIMAMLLFGSTLIARADQNVGIGTAAPDTSALLDLSAVNKGLLVPRMSSTQRDAIVRPATSLLIYNTTASRFEYNSGTPLSPNWVPFSSTSGWNLLGNAGTSPANNFVGTTDANALAFRTNNLERMRILSDGSVGVGTSTPSSMLDVMGNATLSANGGNASALRFMNPAGTVATSIKAGAQLANINYTLPLTAPTAGQFLSSDAAGNMSWTTVNQLPNGGTNINSTLIWNGTTWVSNPNITLNNNTLNIGGPTIQGITNFYDGNGQYVSISVQDLTQNRVYILPEVGDTAYFVMTKGTQIIGGNKSFSNTVNILGGSELRWYEPTAGGNNYVAFKSPLLNNDITYTLPATLPTGTGYLQSDNAGNLNWVNIPPGNSLLTGSGTVNRLALWNGTTSLTSSSLYYDNITNNFGIGTQTPGSRLDVSNGNIFITNNNNTAGELRWYEPSNSGNNYVAFKAPALGNDITYTFPASLPTNAGYLQTDNAGNMNWVNIAPGTNILTGSGTVNRLALWNGTTTLTSSALYYDNNTNNFGIGTQTPGSRMDVSNGNISITNNNNTAGELRWYEPSGDGNNYTAFRAQAQSTNVTYILPASTGTPGQILSVGSGDTLRWISPNASGWALNGNSGTNPNSPANNFLGTIDNQSLALRTNNTERVRFRNDGGIVMGINTSLNNAYGKVQINDNSTANNYAAFGVVSTGVVTGANTVTFAMQASKQTVSTTNVGGYFIASSGTNNYGVVVGNGGDVYLGQVDSLTPPALRNSILANGNPNRTYMHHLNLSGELVTSQASGGFGAGSAGQILISQGASTSPQWANPAVVLSGSVWALDGNTQTTERTLGTTNNYALPIITNGNERMRITADGRVGIGTNAPAASAAAEVFSTDKGFLMPRMTATQRNAIASPAKGLVVYVTTAAEEGFWYSDGSQWLPLTSTISANSTVVVRRKASNQDIANTTTLQDDGDLFMSLGANQMWEVEGMVDYTSASADPDVNFGFSAPAGASFKMTYHSNDGSASAFTSGMNDGSSTSSAQVAAAGATVVHVKGIVVMGGNSGAFRLRWAQNSANATATTARANSYLKFTRIQ